MPDDDRVVCDVMFADDQAKLGEFANALRVLEDSGDEVLIDFCVYSAQENVAKVVSRVRVHRSFVPLIVDRLRQGLAETTSRKRLAMRDGLLVQDGALVLLDLGSRSDH